jgi:type IX secretion system PorP/SprF family membrane protein
MRKTVFALLCMLSYGASAQQEAQFSSYFFNPLQINPAYAGTRGTFNITSVSRAQYIGWAGAPKTQFLTLHTPVGLKHIGTGLTVNYDKIGARSMVNTNFQFAYHLQLNDNNLRLSMGLSGGFQQDRYNFSGLQVIDPTDPNYLVSNSVTKPNFGCGAYLFNDKFYAGISLPRMIKQSLENKTGNSILQQHVYLSGGTVFNVTSVIAIKPSALIKLTANAPITHDYNLSALFYKQLWIGFMYRAKESVGFNTSFQLNDALMIGYAFDSPINGMRLNQWGSHEIVICIDLRASKKAFISPRYF